MAKGTRAVKDYIPITIFIPDRPDMTAVIPAQAGIPLCFITH